MGWEFRLNEKEKVSLRMHFLLSAFWLWFHVMLDGKFESLSSHVLSPGPSK